MHSFAAAYPGTICRYLNPFIFAPKFAYGTGIHKVMRTPRWSFYKHVDQHFPGKNGRRFPFISVV